MCCSATGMTTSCSGTRATTYSSAGRETMGWTEAPARTFSSAGMKAMRMWSFYSDSPSGVTVALNDSLIPRGRGGHAEGDLLTGIEGVVGHRTMTSWMPQATGVTTSWMEVMVTTPCGAAGSTARTT